MTTTARRTRLWGVGATGAALTIAAGCLLPAPIGRVLGNLSYDSAFLFRSDIPTDEVAIIYMDEESHQRLGQDKWMQWDRTLHARLVDRLTDAHAKAIVFDVLFEVTNSPAVDGELVRALKRHGKVAVAAKCTPEVYLGNVIAWQPNLPFAGLREVAALGVVEVEPAGGEGFVRQHYHRKDFDMPSLAWRAAQLTEARPPPPFQERWINYYGPPGMLPHHRYWDVLQMADPVHPTLFSNKVVFVGNGAGIGFTGGKGTDDYRTPYSRWKGTKAAGVEIIATSYLNLKNRNWLERTSVIVELALLAVLGALFGYGLSQRRSPIQALSIGMAAALLAGVVANIFVWKTRIWFPWLVVSCLQIPVAIAWSVLVHTRRLTREKSALEREVAVTRAGEQIFARFKLARKSAETVSPAISEHELLNVPDHKLVRQIGKGGYGEVWLAQDIIGSYHAVKIVHRKHFADKAPFEREFNGLKRFTPISMGHPSLVHVLHVGRSQQPEYIYYVMELADDEVAGQKIDPLTYAPKNLANELKKRKGLPVAESVQIALQLSDALAYLHDQQLIHRDIKPSNIIFVKGVPKLADIGLVTQVATEGQDVSYGGTEGYIPPDGPGTLADIYSFGKLVYQVATGFDVSRFPELPTGLLQGKTEKGLIALNRIILKACATAPGKRYQTARELHDALSALNRELELNQLDSAKP